MLYASNIEKPLHNVISLNKIELFNRVMRLIKKKWKKPAVNSSDQINLKSLVTADL